MKLFFPLATVAMITEKFPFSFFHGYHCLRKKFLEENNEAVNPSIPEKWNQTDKEFSKKSCHEGISHCND